MCIIITEIEKIILDKILLTASVVASGLIINYLIEKRRDRNIRLQKLAERKIDFYEKLSGYVARLKWRGNEFISVLLTRKDENLFENNEQIQMHLDRLNALHEEGYELISQAQIHLSKATINLLQEVHQTQHVLSNVWQDKQALQEKFPSVEENPLNSGCIDLLLHLRAEISDF